MTIDPELDPSVAQGGSTTVSVGDDEFFFSQEVQDLTTNSWLIGTFFSDDEALTFDVFLPPDGWESGADDEGWVSSVRLDDFRGGKDIPISWRAGDEFMELAVEIPPEVAVNSSRVDGETTSGTATVVRSDALATGIAETAEMTFAVSCL